MGDILKYVDKLNELDVEGVEPTAHAVPLTNVLREDKPRESLSHEAAMRNAPKTSSGLFIVPKNRRVIMPHTLTISQLTDKLAQGEIVLARGHPILP